MAGDRPLSGRAPMRVVLALALNAAVNFLIGLVVAHFLNPEEFGRFALTLAAGALLQLALFDWLRLAATRFHTSRSFAERPYLRATLDAGFLACASVVLCVAGLAVMGGVELAGSAELLGLAAITAIVNGFFDYWLAIARARFADRVFARMLLVKNLLATTACLGAAWLTGSALFAVAGMVIAMGGSLLSVWGSLHDPKARDLSPRLDIAGQALSYARPIIAAALLAQAMAYVTRSLMAGHYGFGEAGHFSLAFDLGHRLFLTIAVGLDILLFQVAVRAHEVNGADAARAQASQNALVVLAVMMPAAAGLWFVLPSLEVVLAPQEFHGAFRRFFALSLPGLFCLALTVSAIAPFFQLARRTGPLLVAGLIGCASNAALLFYLPASAENLALSLSVSFVIATVWLLAQAGWLRLGQVAVTSVFEITVATGLMCLVLLPLNGLAPGPATLMAQVLLGAAAYGLLVLILDIGGLRRALRIARTRPV